MPVRTERSAGLIVFRFRGGSREYLLLDYGRYWEYPKGHVEKDEDDLTAAIRELAEETGITDVDPIEGFHHEIAYFFRDKRKGLIRKTVAFFLGRTSASEIKISPEHVGAEFLTYELAMQRLSYANSKKALEAANAFLDRAAPV
jgi:8-oxo-dGTP pyrophosphatase MutT (NUDIX family)